MEKMENNDNNPRPAAGDKADSVFFAEAAALTEEIREELTALREDPGDERVRQMIEERVFSSAMTRRSYKDCTALIDKAVAGKARIGAVRFDLHPGLDNKSGDEIFL